MCGEIEPDELVTGSPAFVINNTLDFGMLMFDKNQLCPGGLTLFNEPNLGGNSKYSEVFAYEMLYRCELATLLKTEANIVYAVEGKKTDFLAEIDGLKVGVSVTRAYKYMAPFTTNDALALLTKKLSDINQSTQNVAPDRKS
ncbi:MAG TPA: hypothetical protein ENK23_07215, partial [Sorangium sp.]|nr:hypothetical protein [Sorangium sp.]